MKEVSSGGGLVSPVKAWLGFTISGKPPVFWEQQIYLPNYIMRQTIIHIFTFSKHPPTIWNETMAHEESEGDVWTSHQVWTMGQHLTWHCFHWSADRLILKVNTWIMMSKLMPSRNATQMSCHVLSIYNWIHEFIDYTHQIYCYSCKVDASTCSIQTGEKHWKAGMKNNMFNLPTLILWMEKHHSTSNVQGTLWIRFPKPAEKMLAEPELRPLPNKNGRESMAKGNGAQDVPETSPVKELCISVSTFC